MSIEDIIDSLEELEKYGVDMECDRMVLRRAIALLRTHPAAQPDEPLTLEELRGMDGDPVWLKTLGEDFEDGWQIVVDVDKLRVHFRQFYAPTFCEDYGSTWAAYRRPPKENT
ncbi:hypothetical protein [Vermiculatibacterium agrestimuris]|uniref:hypothetical protein n=1 Tax=Vermiculatibacterium agrestimuris TaxID=2941519 RepID=UPI00203F6A7D|nr:hypothetical protein [Vermiculatibacterium agrestimuris]